MRLLMGIGAFFIGTFLVLDATFNHYPRVEGLLWLIFGAACLGPSDISAPVQPKCCYEPPAPTIVPPEVKS